MRRVAAVLSRAAAYDPAFAFNEEEWGRERGRLVEQCFRIRPGEAFNAIIEWKKAPRLSKPRKIVVALDGYMWQPI